MDRPQIPVGTPRGFYVYPEQRTLFRDQWLPGIWVPHKDATPNTVMYDWATVAAKLLAGQSEYKVAGMYFEFQNVADPDDAVAIPSYDRAGGIAYYEGLADSDDTDYLRVALTAAVVTVGDGADDADRYPAGNVTTFFAQTQGTVGTHGKPFNDAVFSKVFGGALVAMPDPEDASLDLIVSRFYFPSDKQQVKLAGAQIGNAWPLKQQ